MSNDKACVAFLVEIFGNGHLVDDFNDTHKCICDVYSLTSSIYIAREAQPGRAELWRCLGCKFKSYLEQFKGSDGIGRHE